MTQNARLVTPGIKTKMEQGGPLKIALNLIEVAKMSNMDRVRRINDLLKFVKANFSLANYEKFLTVLGVKFKYFKLNPMDKHSETYLVINEPNPGDLNFSKAAKYLRDNESRLKRNDGDTINKRVLNVTETLKSQLELLKLSRFDKVRRIKELKDFLEMVTLTDNDVVYFFSLLGLRYNIVMRTRHLEDYKKFYKKNNVYGTYSYAIDESSINSLNFDKAIKLIEEAFEVKISNVEGDYFRVSLQNASEFPLSRLTISEDAGIFGNAKKVSNSIFLCKEKFGKLQMIHSTLLFKVPVEQLQ